MMLFTKPFIGTMILSHMHSQAGFPKKNPPASLLCNYFVVYVRYVHSESSCQDQSEGINLIHTYHVNGALKPCWKHPGKPFFLFGVCFTMIIVTMMR